MLPPCDRIGENITQQLVYTVTLWQSDAARCVMQQMIHSYNKRVCFTPTRTVKGGKVMCAYVSRVFTFAEQHVSLCLGQSVQPASVFVLQSPGGSGQRASGSHVSRAASCHRFASQLLPAATHAAISCLLLQLQPSSPFPVYFYVHWEHNSICHRAETYLNSINTSAPSLVCIWFPFSLVSLHHKVISPDCHEDMTVKKDNIFVRSFKDGKLWDFFQ